MLTRLTGIAISVIGFLGTAGYAALSTYLSIFGLDTSIGTFGRFGYIHYGVLVLAANAPALSIFVGIYLAAAYCSFRANMADPFFSVYLDQTSKRISFRTYIGHLFASESVRKICVTAFDLTQFFILVAVLILGAMYGENYGTLMAKNTVSGVASVENPNIHVEQRIKLRFSSLANPSPALMLANDRNQLNILWTSDRVSSFIIVDNRPITEAAPHKTWTIPSGDIAQIERVRDFKVPKLQSPSAVAHWPDVTRFWPLLCIAGLLLVVVAVPWDYVRRRDTWVRIDPLRDDLVSNIEMPDVVADNISSALAVGKDIQVVSNDTEGRTLTIIRNDAFPLGHRIRSVYSAANPWKDLASAIYRSFFREQKTPNS